MVSESEEERGEAGEKENEEESRENEEKEDRLLSISHVGEVENSFCECVQAEIHDFSFFFRFVCLTQARTIHTLKLP